MGRPHAKIKRHKKSSRRPRKERHQHTRIEENPSPAIFPSGKLSTGGDPFSLLLSPFAVFITARASKAGFSGRGRTRVCFGGTAEGGGRGKRERLILPITLCVQTAPRAEGRGRGREKRKVANFLEKKNCRELSSDVRRVGQKRKGGGGIYCLRVFRRGKKSGGRGK